MLASNTMPNTRAAAKRQRADQKRRERNLKLESELKSLTRKFRKLSANGSSSDLETLYRALSKRLDQAASKGLIHRNRASRKKSRLARLIAKLRS